MNFTKARGLAPRIGLALAACLGFAGGAYANNDQTAAGSTVSNTFTLNYEVSNTAQPEISNATTPTQFTVDRRVDLVLTATNSALLTTPGATSVLTFELVNDGNDFAAYSFSIADLDTGSGTFDATSVEIRYLIDADNNNTADDGSYALIAETATSAGSGAADVTANVEKGQKVFVQVSGTIPAGTEDNETDQITLIAQVRNPSAYINDPAISVGEVTTGDSGSNNPLGVAQNVLADGTGVAGTDVDRDGLFAANGVFDVESPDLTADKEVLVIAEPGVSGPITNCDSIASPVANAKAVPGACVEYTITVENTGDSVAASNLVISDTLPAEVTYVSATLSANIDDDPTDPATGPTLSFPTNATDSNCDGSTNCQITLTDAQLAASTTGTIVIRALIK